LAQASSVAGLGRRGRLPAAEPAQRNRLLEPDREEAVRPERALRLEEDEARAAEKVRPPLEGAGERLRPRVSAGLRANEVASASRDPGDGQAGEAAAVDDV